MRTNLRKRQGDLRVNRYMVRKEQGFEVSESDLILKEEYLIAVTNCQW